MKNVRVVTSVPPGLAVLLDDMVGSIYGETRAECVRFILQSWMTSNIATVNAWRKRREAFDAAQQPAARGEPVQIVFAGGTRAGKKTRQLRDGAR